MIGRCALGRAPLLPCPKSLAARASFGCDHRCSFHIDDVNIHLTGVAFPGNRIFTLSTFSGAIQARVFRTCSIAIATRSRDPGSPPRPPPRDRAEAEGPIEIKRQEEMDS